MYKLLRPESILHVDELMKERRTNEELRDHWFYTADGEVYSLQGGNRTPTLAITRGSSNPLFQDSTIDDYCQQLLENKNYRPTPEENQRALQAPATVVVDLTKLKLRGNHEEWRYLTIDTRKYKKLNPEEEKLAQRVYGKDNDFVQNMKILADAGIRETRAYVLNPDYVCRNATKNSLGRASWLNLFNYGSVFIASDRSVDIRYYARGVLREVVVSKNAEGAAPGNVPSAPQEVKVPGIEDVFGMHP